MLKPGLLQLVMLQLVETTCSKSVDNSFDNQLAISLLTTLQQTCRQQAVSFALQLATINYNYYATVILIL